MLVVGAEQLNSNRLREIGAEQGAVVSVDDADLDLAMLGTAQTVGVSAGASAPEELLYELIDKLRKNLISKLKKLKALRKMLNSNCHRNHRC